MIQKQNVNYLLCLLVFIAFSSCQSKSTILNSKNNVLEIIYKSTISMEPGDGEISEHVIIYSPTTKKTLLAGMVVKKSDYPNNDKYIDENGFVVEKMERKKWESLLYSIDFKEFFELEHRIGCPGCLDEPVESVTIKTSEKTHQVIFSEPPKPLKAFLRSMVE